MSDSRSGTSGATSPQDLEALIREIRHSHEEQVRWGERRRELILLAYESGVTTRRIAADIGVGQTTVSYWLKVAREERTDGTRLPHRSPRTR